MSFERAPNGSYTGVGITRVRVVMSRGLVRHTKLEALVWPCRISARVSLHTNIIHIHHICKMTYVIGIGQAQEA